MTSHMGIVMVVEDTLASLKLITEMLTNAGYRVLPADSGELALASIANHPPELILLDIKMPGMDGFEVMRKLQQNEETRVIPVMFLSAMTEAAQRLEGLRLGAVDFLTKPFDHEEVLARVHTQITLSRTRIQLERHAEEIQLTNQLLLRAQEQLMQSEKMAGIGQLAAGVAHELNNPIGFIQSNLGTLTDYVERLLSIIDAAEHCAESCPSTGKFERFQALTTENELPYLRQDVRDLLAESKEGADRVRSIVQNLKDFSHVSEKNKVWTDLHAGLESTLRLVWNEIKYKAEVEKHYGTLPAVFCRGGEINQVFMNLLVNAAQAIETKGKIVVTTGTERDDGANEGPAQRVWIEIADTGKGISPDNLTHVFEPFFTTKPVGKGTGLGLSLAWSIIQKHHGTLSVKSTEGTGTTFRVSLPVDGDEIPVG